MPDFSPRLDYRDRSPVPHPQAGGEIPADPEQEGADRVGDYVRRALTRELEKQGVPWPVQVAWSEHAVYAWLSRGELTLSTQERRRRWWAPTRDAPHTRADVPVLSAIRQRQISVRGGV